MRTFWKRFAASATAFAIRYRGDPFFRTECNVIGLLTLFTLCTIVTTGLTLSRLYTTNSAALIQGVRDIALLPTANQPQAITDLTNALKANRSLIFTTFIMVEAFLAIIFGYILARATLAPARNALESQKRFIGNIAHELRTPLSIIKTNTEVSLFGAEIDNATREILQSNVEELDRISAIINNLLSLSSAVRPERVEFSNVDLGSVVDDVVRSLQSMAKRKRLEVVVRKGDFRIVWGNAAALEQIASNLIKNAINHTPEGGTINITIEADYANQVEFAVQDTGVGIDRKDLFHIFEPFYRAEPSRNRGAGVGSGLGLTIVNELVRLHQGKITIRSAPGRGTTATVSLPCGKHPDGSDVPRLSDGFDEIASDYSRSA